MYDVKDMKVVPTSSGYVLVIKDEDGDFHTIAFDTAKNLEAIEKYIRREK